MVGYVFLLLSFPVEMTQWLPPRMGDLDYQRLGFGEHVNYVFTGRLPLDLDIDALTRATPLDLVKEGLRAGRPFAEIRSGSLFGDFGGRGWEWVANFIALGGLYLLYTGTIRWHIPTAFFAGLLVPATVLYLVDPTGYAAPGFHLFSGASMLGAFFIATEPVSAAGTVRGRLIYGAGIGLFVYAAAHVGRLPRRRGVLRIAHERRRAADQPLHPAAHLWPTLKAIGSAPCCSSASWPSQRPSSSRVATTGAASASRPTSARASSRA